MKRYKKLLDIACMWGITINLFVFTYALFQDLASLQLLSLVNICLLLVHFIVER